MTVDPPDDPGAADELERRRTAGRALPARRAGTPANGLEAPAEVPLPHPIPDRRDELVRLLVGLVLLGLFLAFLALIALGYVVGPG